MLENFINALTFWPRQKENPNDSLPVPPSVTTEIDNNPDQRRQDMNRVAQIVNQTEAPAA